jgi:hypothetical protein
LFVGEVTSLADAFDIRGLLPGVHWCSNRLFLRVEALFIAKACASAWIGGSACLGLFVCYGTADTHFSEIRLQLEDFGFDGDLI